MTTRRMAFRKALTAELSAVTEIQVAYDHVPNELGGESPVVTVASDGSQLERTPREAEYVQLEVGVWVLREEDPATAEDMLDIVRERLKTIVSNRYNGDFIQTSEPDYVEMDGKSWRVEFHRVGALRP